MGQPHERGIRERLGQPPGSVPPVARQRQVHAPCEVETYVHNAASANAAALRRLIDTAYSDIKARVEHG